MLIDVLKEIIRMEEDVLPFLKELSLNRKEKTAFVKEVKELRKVVFERKEVREESKWGISTTFKQTHTDKQQQIIDTVCFVYYNKTDARRSFQNTSFIVDDYVIEKILPRYVPKWYSDLVNEINPWHLNYKKIIYLYQEGYLEPSKELVVSRLPYTIRENAWENEINKTLYCPEILWIDKVTLTTHIWYLFEEESGINDLSYYNNFENYQKLDDVWIHTISNLINEQKIDRRKTLIATIYTATKGFNKNLSGWFFELLLHLNLTREEVLSLQDELFSALNSPHSKVINTVLKYFKIAAADKNFQHTIFIENASILLSSEVKSVVNSALMILDKIAKANTSLYVSICKKASEALLNVDEKIQIRAAKIITKYGDTANEELCDEVGMYVDNLLYAAKEILNDYIQIDATELTKETEEIQESIPVEILSAQAKLPVYETFDDLIFFISQVLDNNEVYHIDLVLFYLPKLNLLIDKSNVSRLTPIFKRAFDLSISHDWNSQIGYIEYMMSLYINDLGKELIKKYPAELNDFWSYRDKKFKEDTWSVRNKSDYERNFKNHSIPDYVYNIHRFLIAQSQDYIIKKEALELLFMPTHAPCWIAPEVFLDRVIRFQKQGEKINFCDFQIGLGRIPLTEMTTQISRKIDQINGEEIRLILRYHFGGVQLKNCTITKPRLWLQSILTRKNAEDIEYFETISSTHLRRETALYNWSCQINEDRYETYDYQQKKNVERVIVKKHLKFNNIIEKTHTYTSVFKSIKNFFNKKVEKKAFDEDNIYKFIYFKRRAYEATIQAHDDVKFLFLAPNNPGPYLAQVIHNNMKESKFKDEGSKKNMINILKGLYEIWYRKDYSETTYLFLATGFLCSDKVAREIAAEIWIKTISEHTMNPILLGKTIGKLQFGEYAPMKRLTDILALNLFNVSKMHNTYLFEFIRAIFPELSDTPIRGLKKLLELFLELKRNLPTITINEETINKFHIWKTSNTLKVVIDKLLV